MLKMYFITTQTVYQLPGDQIFCLMIIHYFNKLILQILYAGVELIQLCTSFLFDFKKCLRMIWP